MQNRKHSHLVILFKIYFINNLVNPSSFRTYLVVSSLSIPKTLVAVIRRKLLLKKRKTHCKKVNQSFYFFKPNK